MFVTIAGCLVMCDWDRLFSVSSAASQNWNMTDKQFHGAKNVFHCVKAVKAVYKFYITINYLSTDEYQLRFRLI